MTGRALEVDGLRVAHGDLTAVWDVSLRAEPGRTCALVGRNGAGKTTFLAGVAGLLPTLSGSVRLGGEDLTGLPAHRRASAGVAMVQEGKRVFRDMTVRENLTLGLIPSRERGRRAHGRFEEVFERFPALAARPDALAGTLSGGQQQMLAIAQALIGRPSVILLDEPSSGLAPIIVDEVLALVGELRADGLAVVLVEQLVTDVMSGVADDLVLIDQGRVVLQGTPSEFTVEQLAAAAHLA
jgi:branched-chain amino acid transport system ATP-binding protein